MRGSAIVCPDSLPARTEALRPLADSCDLAYREFPDRLLGEWAQGKLQSLQEVLELEPALLLLPTSIPLTQAFAEQLSNRCGCVANASTGTNHVDFLALERAGVGYLNAPGCNAPSVAEYVLAAIPLIFPERQWVAARFTVGIVGYGRIGRLLGDCLTRMGLRVRVYDPFVDAGALATGLREVLASDLVTVHVPLTDHPQHPTRGMIDSGSLPARGSGFINTARGPVLTEAAFSEIAANCVCVMDVFPQEPPSNAMLHAPLFVTPHIAGYNHASRTAGVHMVAEGFARRRGLEFKSAPSPAGQPPEPDCYVLDFIPAEDRRLRSTGEFHQRRRNYPLRADMGASLTAIEQGYEPAYPIAADYLERLRTCF